MAMSIIDRLLPAETGPAADVKPVHHADDQQRGPSQSIATASSASPASFASGEPSQADKRKRSRTDLQAMNIGNGQGLSGLRRESYESDQGEAQPQGVADSRIPTALPTTRRPSTMQANQEMQIAGSSSYSQQPGYPTYAVTASRMDNPAPLHYALLPHSVNQAASHPGIQYVPDPAAGPVHNYVPHAASWQQTTYHAQFHAPPYIAQPADPSRPIPLTPSPQASHASTGGWNGQAHYDLQVHPGSDSQRQGTPSDLSTPSMMQHPSPESHLNQPVMVPRYDKSCCDGLFDCSSIPTSMRPVMHNITVSATGNSAAATLSFERGIAPAGNAPSWPSGSPNQHGSARAAQKPPGLPPTTATWPGPNPGVASGTPPAVNRTSASPPLIHASDAAGLQGVQDAQDAEDQKCCWGVIDCAPPATTVA